MALHCTSVNVCAVNGIKLDYILVNGRSTPASKYCYIKRGDFVDWFGKQSPFSANYLIVFVLFQYKYVYPVKQYRR